MLDSVSNSQCLQFTTGKLKTKYFEKWDIWNINNTIVIIIIIIQLFAFILWRFSLFEIIALATICEPLHFVKSIVLLLLISQCLNAISHGAILRQQLSLLSLSQCYCQFQLLLGISVLYLKIFLLEFPVFLPFIGFNFY